MKTFSGDLYTMSDIHTMLDEAEAFIRHAASASTDKATELRQQALEAIVGAKQRASVLKDQASEVSQVAIKATDNYVHEHPWQAVGMAAAVGLILGLLIARR